MSDNTDKLSRKGLFQIGEVASCCGIDRQTIIFYEKKGLLKATEQDNLTGYRYYSAESVSELLFILGLREAGLSLTEIGQYIENGAKDTPAVLENMKKKLAALQQSIEKISSMSVERGDLSVHETIIPEQLCVVRQLRCKDVTDAISKFFDVIAQAMRLGLPLERTNVPFAEFPEESGDRALSMENFLMRVCIPVLDCGNSIKLGKYEKTPGIYVCCRGDFSVLDSGYKALYDYAQENGLEPAGLVREQYIDSRRDYLFMNERNVTRLVLPIKKPE